MRWPARSIIRILDFSASKNSCLGLTSTGCITIVNGSACSRRRILKATSFPTDDRSEAIEVYGWPLAPESLKTRRQAGNNHNRPASNSRYGRRSVHRACRSRGWKILSWKKHAAVVRDCTALDCRFFEKVYIR